MAKARIPLWLVVLLTALLSFTLFIAILQKPVSYELETSVSPSKYSSIQDYASAKKSADSKSTSECIYVPVNLPLDTELSYVSARDGSYYSLIYTSKSDPAATFQYSQHFVDPDIAIPKMVQNNSGLYTEFVVGDRIVYYALGPKHHFLYEFDDSCFIVEIPVSVKQNGVLHEITVEEAIMYLDLTKYGV